MTVSLKADARERVLEFVRPLSVGVDGTTSYGFVERRLAIVERLAERTRELEPGVALDEGRLFLLAAFAGLPERRQAGGGRTELLLGSLGVPREEIAALLRSLRRLDAPRGLEEALVHDAGLLETVGAYGVAQIIVASARERASLAETADEITERLRGARFLTVAGRSLSAARIALALQFADRLREEALEFG